ncbi:ABC transporter ATP-binding protein [Dyadobacter psychrophilus]|uniref:ABC-type multidrug transport system, ATPase and permease component n=1 Tax=Dyadobacter psychrophilus TaxID=651661 RepID=A0A1T5HD70_9BACT|nr:ABC transporter ATP-binding protein [Dyadobacter psychrophilus]SKC18471.1 ABC-type multidrug transport system, ATPase and permease component [Dyadobacter psychrophilus]
MSNPYISLLVTAWRYARQQRKHYVLVYAMFIMANIVLATNPLLYGWFVQSIQKDPSGILDNVWLYVGGYVLLTVGEWVFHGPARIMERKLAFDMSKNFLDEMYHQALHLPIRWHQDHHSGATINRIRKAYEALRDFFQNGFMFLHAFAKFIFSFIAIVWFSPIFGGIGVLIGIINIWVIFKFDKPFIKALDETNEREHVVSSTLFDSLSNIITVITLRLEKRMKISLMAKVDDVFPPFVRSITVNEWKWFVASMFIALIYVVVTVGYIYQNYVPGQVFLVGGLVTLLSYVNQFTSVFQDIAWQYTEIIRYNTEVQTARSISETYKQQHRPDATEGLPDHWREIEIHDLNFSHGEVYDREKQAHSLHGLHIRIKKGQRIAFIGESGSGKSTLLALLRGLYAPEAGVNVLVDGKQPTDMQTLADQITLFPQDPEIFENTIAYNITLGLPFDQEEILEVCQTAHFTDVIAKLPNGLNSNIQERGVNLSGGQKQRLALARGILAARSSEIVLLDEPTSSVDPKTESLIYDRMFAEFKDKAVISTLHRLHLLTKFDYVYILRDGHLVDEGTFAELRANSAVFQDLWRHQEAMARG